MADYPFHKVAVYDQLGGVVRLARNSRINVTDPATGLVAAGLKVSGVAVSFVTTDTNGTADFTSTLGTVDITAPNGLSERISSHVALEAAAGAGISSDAAVAALIANPASATRVAGDVVYAASSALTVEQARAVAAEGRLAPLGANIQGTVRKLQDGVSDVKILVLGDSTASQAGQWPDELMPDVQVLYPHRTLYKSAWGGASYGAASQVGASGTGSGRIDYFAGAVTGTVPESVWATWDAQVAAVQPDLVIIHFGHNYGKNAADGGQPDDATMDYVFRERMLRFVGEVKKSLPRADVMVNSQNPYLTAGARTGISTIRAQTIREICADLGCAYGPSLEAYIATGSPSTYLQADLLHPNSAGANLTAAALLPQFRYQPNIPASARQSSPFLLPGRNLLLNGDFASFASPPTLTAWTAISTTLSKDTTSYESGNSYSVKGTGTAVANQQIYQSLPIRRVQGQVITLAARLFVPTGMGSQPGRVQISGDGGTVTTSSGTLTNIRDAWAWAFVTVRIPNAATFATASILTGGAISDTCSIDRAIAVVGHMPRGLP